MRNTVKKIIYTNKVLDRWNNELYIEVGVYSNVTLVMGDSGTGKSFLYDTVVKEYKSNISTGKKTRKVLAFNYNSDTSTMLSSIKAANSCLILIDNADILLDSKARRYIAKDNNNTYIIFGREPEGLGLMSFSLAEVAQEGNKLFLSYDFVN